MPGSTLRMPITLGAEPAAQGDGQSVQRIAEPGGIQVAHEQLSKNQGVGQIADNGKGTQLLDAQHRIAMVSVGV